MTRRPRSAALLAAILVAASLLGGCGSDTADDPDPASGTTGHHSSQATPSDGSSPSSTAQADQVTVPVYFVGDTPQGPRLYREFRRVDAADPLGEALSLAASGAALGPDYGTLLPAATFTTSGDATIPLPDDSWQKLPDGMQEADAQLALQQLVYTAQGVLQSRDPITFTDADGNPTQVFYTASEDGFTAADPIKTLALVNVTSPEQGATVSGSFTASGVSSSFEATTPWELRNASGKVVKRGSATAEGWMDKLYPWETEVDVSGLPPGDYTFVVMTDDPSGGEGPGPMQDSKDITIS